MSPQGLLVILDGGKGLRSAVKKVFRDRALVHRCQWHKRENVVSYLPKSEQADWRRRLQRAYNRPTYEEALAALEKLHAELEERNQSAAAQPGGGPRRDPDPAPARRLRRAGTLVQDDQLPRVRQCSGRGALRQGRPLEELEPTTALVGHGARRHRAAPAEGDGLPSPAEAARGVESENSRSRRRHQVRNEEEGRVTNHEPWRLSTKNGLDSHCSEQPCSGLAPR